MDLAETMRKLVDAAGPAGEITVDIFKELIPEELSAEDLEQLINSLNAEGIWIVEK